MIMDKSSAVVRLVKAITASPTMVTAEYASTRVNAQKCRAFNMLWGRKASARAYGWRVCCHLRARDANDGVNHERVERDERPCGAKLSLMADPHPTDGRS